jgi:DNA polymerase-3 subunit gamma/tau
MTTLYRKYRPSLFSEISGQEHILQTLTNSIKNSQVSHAYLFTGPRGTGKTTTARIFAKTVNCLKPITKTQADHVGIEPCNECANCKMILDHKAIDLIEIDAASHTGVDNIRQLKEAINIPPTNFKYKVYIIDEVHMLSIGAFNALLKTLEEPPAHAIFILATTELHKVPDTIISRCQQFNVKPLTKDEIITRLSQIAKKEKIETTPETLTLIATEAGGGMRDAESLLGQIISTGEKKITAKDVRYTLGISPKSTLLKLITDVAKNDMLSTVNIINKLQADGTSLISFNKQLLSYCRNLILVIIGEESNAKLLKNSTADELVELQKIASFFSLSKLTILISLLQNSLTNSNQSDIPQLPLEMALIEYFLKTSVSKELSSSQPLTSKTSADLKKKSSELISATPKIKIPKKNTSDNFSPEKSTVTKEPLPTNATSVTIAEVENTDYFKDVAPMDKASLSINNFLDKWAEILEEVKEKSLSIAGVLKNCAPTAIDEKFVLIKVNHAFGQKRLNDPKSKLTIEKVFANIFKVRLRAKFLTEDELPQDAPKMKKKIITIDESIESVTEQSSESDNEILYEAMKKIGGKMIKAE